MVNSTTFRPISQIDLRITNMQKDLSRLKEENKKLAAEFEVLSAELSKGPTVYKEVIRLHIKRLKEYNELKDTGLRLIQMIADEKSCRNKEVVDEMGYTMED